MSWLRRTLRRTPQLSAAQLQTLAEWQALPATDLRRPLDAARLVVVDVESSGLDAHRDRLISIGALAVNHGVIELAQSFEVVLRQTAPSAIDNILVHGIGGTEQCSGTDPVTALLSFLRFAGTDPLFAFHADFDRVMLGRALDATVGTDLRQPWLDLASLAPALLGRRAPRAKNLDDWLTALGIHNYARHNAVADALSTAQLLLVVLGACAGEQVKTLADLIETERAQHWLERR